MKTKLPFIFALLTMVSGVSIAIAFGVNEDFFKNKIATDIKQNQKILNISDPSIQNTQIESLKSKSWRYYQRFHFHATGIGAMSVAALILLTFTQAPPGLKLLNSYFISIGGFFYPFVWLFSGVYGPIMGAKEAKESFAIFGYMGGVFLLGLLILLLFIFKYPFTFHKKLSS